MRNKKLMITFIILLLIIIIGLLYYKKVIKKDYIIDKEPVVQKEDKISFDFKVLKETNNLVKNENYLISPLSMGYALSLLNEGANDKTKDEISNALGNYKLPYVINIKDRIGIANLLFVKNIYKNDINENYINILKEKYSSDLIFDEFSTPDKANEWISDKTFKMIPNAIDGLNPDFVLGLANTIAIDVEWKSKFECQKTHEDDFTQENGKPLKVAMMEGNNDAYYIENENAKGIIKDYKLYDTVTNKEAYEENENTIALEYIAILPNKDIKEYLKIFNENELKRLLESKKESNNDLDINYSLPKYKYDYTYNDFQTMLNNLGIKDVFDSNSANLRGMIKKDSLLQLFVSKSIHKTHIDLSENGTKAAAVTVFLIDKNAAFYPPKDKIEIKFNKPFIYIIKDKNSDNIWFFGTVYEPLKWEDNSDSCNFN